MEDAPDRPTPRVRKAAPQLFRANEAGHTVRGDEDIVALEPCRGWTGVRTFQSAIA